MYQKTQSALNGCVKVKCFEAMAQAMVKMPSENGKTIKIFRFRSICAFKIIGIGMLIIIRSELRLKARLRIK